MSSELTAALIGAVVGGGFAVIGTVIQHFLAIREYRIKADLDAKKHESERIRQQLARRDVFMPGYGGLPGTTRPIGSIGIPEEKDKTKEPEKPDPPDMPRTRSSTPARTSSGMPSSGGRPNRLVCPQCGRRGRFATDRKECIHCGTPFP